MSTRAALPEKITLGVRTGTPPSEAPPVRIYLGTEAAQFRANRVFVWSIEKVRDPARVYEIYLMSELAGFDRRGWTTGFTNYRFAIPHFAGGRGRAIYNDEDQIYLSDPAELFDLDLGEHGFLAISDTESSVMLIDCEKMSAHWTLASAQRDSKKSILRRTLERPGIRGELDPGWNARDEEFEPGRSHLIHYTTLHTQPWRPFPERFAYQRSPHEELWLETERDALDAGFDLFSSERPSRAFGRFAESESGQLGSQRSASQVARAGRALQSLAVGTDRVLELASGAEARESGFLTGRVADVETRALGSWLEEPGSAAAYDLVFCAEGLEKLPVLDTAWAVDRLFAASAGRVFAALSCPRPPERRRGGPPAGLVHTPEWWRGHFENAARRHPGVHYELLCWVPPGRRSLLGFARHDDTPTVRTLVGGAAVSENPVVWLLSDDRPGNTTQSQGLADALGWPYQEKSLRFAPTSLVPNPLVGASLSGLDSASREAIAPPWPDLVIAAGRRSAPVGRFIKEASQGRTRLVHLGRKGANPAEAFDLAVTPVYARLFPHPRRIETLAPLTRIRPAALAEAASEWKTLFAGHPSPRFALLIGGASQRHVFDAQVADRLARDVAAFVERAGGSLFVTTSRRTPEAALRALEAVLGDAAHLHCFRAEEAAESNPFLGYLALADAFVVTGESESMIAEACATGKPVYIYPLPDRPAGVFFGAADALIDAVVSRAYAQPQNNRGTTRPQQGLEHLCSRLVERGFVRPNRDLHLFHRELERRGVARLFPGPEAAFEPASQEPYSETERVAARVRSLMGFAKGAPNSR